MGLNFRIVAMMLAIASVLSMSVESFAACGNGFLGIRGRVAARREARTERQAVGQSACTTCR